MFRKNILFVYSLLAFIFTTTHVRGDDHLACPPDLSGNWSNGYWRSDSSGHRGPLRARFKKIDEMQYRVVFRGRFAKIIPFRYSVKLNVTGYQGNKVLLAGSSRLPFFGAFHYSAEASCCDFTANYHSCSDRGVFVLCR